MRCSAGGFTGLQAVPYPQSIVCRLYAGSTLVPMDITPHIRCKHQWRVDTLALSFFRDYKGHAVLALTHMLKCTWSELDGHATSFSTLRHVIAGFTSVSLFVREVEPQISHLFTGNKLKYALETREQQEWVAYDLR